MLGLVGLGNLLQSYGEPIRMVCGILATVMGIVLVAKVALYPEDFRRDMANPMLASIAGTFPMALLLLAGYAKPVLESLGYLLWYLGLALHLALIVWFTAEAGLPQLVHRLCGHRRGIDHRPRHGQGRRGDGRLLVRRRHLRARLRRGGTALPPRG